MHGLPRLISDVVALLSLFLPPALAAAPPGPPPLADRPIFHTYRVPDASPHGIVYNPAGPLQGLWYDNATADATSNVTQFRIGSAGSRRYRTPTPGARPGSINVAPDSSLWFTETSANKIATIGATRTIVEYPIPTPGSSPLDITRGPDGAMWFTETAAGKIGRIAPDGTITEFPIGAGTRPTAVITGADGALWFTEVGTGRIGRLTASGSLKHFDAGPGHLSGDITVATDNALWFNKDASVTRMTMTGQRTEFALPSGVIETGAIFGSRNGGVYLGAIKNDGTGAIIAVSSNGTTREYDLPQRYLLPIEMAQTANGAFWMTVASVKPGVSASTLFELR